MQHVPFCPCAMTARRVKADRLDDAAAHHNIWNEVLYLFTLVGCSPSVQQGLDDWELCRVALSCHFALDVIYAFTE